MARGFIFDGKRIPAEPHDTVASALHRQGVKVLGRSMKYHRPRGVFCNAGSCASCYVEIDGVPNLPACLQAAEGVEQVRSQNRLGSAKRDLLRVVDLVYPNGFDPHGAFTFPGPVNRLFVRSVRMMSGWGKAPADASPLRGRRHTHARSHVVIGAGRHGLAQAMRLADAGHDPLVIEEMDRPGGTARFSHEPDTDALATACKQAGVELWCQALAFGIYGKTVAVRRGNDLHEVQAEHIIISPGTHDAVPVFDNNDLPGIMSERGARRMLIEQGVLPGRHVVICGQAPADLSAALEKAGAAVSSGDVTAAHGRTQVKAATVDGRRVSCDLIITTGPGLKRIELVQQAGCRMGWDGHGPAPVTSGDGETDVPGVRALFSGVDA